MIYTITMKNTTLKTLIFTFLTFILIVVSCTKDDNGPSSDATSIELLSEDNLIAVAGATVENPIEVMVKDQFGKAFAETVVHFTPSNGSVSSSTVKTDARGIASVLWTVGGNSGEQTLTVTAFKTDGITPLRGSPFMVTANAEGDAVSESLVLVSGGGQTGQVETILTNPIIINVKDTNENPFAGATVNFATTDGSVSSSSGLSDADGNVTVNWTLGATLGTQTLTVTGFKADGTTPLTGSPLTVTATGTSEPAFADILQKVSGDSQTGTVNTALANPIVVRVLDQFENPFAGATVNFATTDGSVSSSSGLSDADGNVTVNWTLGATLGTQTLTVTGFKADGTTPLSESPLTVTATATAVAAVADSLELVSGDNQTGTAGELLANPIVIRVLDQFENPFAGATVYFTPDGDESPSTLITDANGLVSINWTLTGLVNTQNMKVESFKADGTTPLTGSPLTVTATGTSLPAFADILQKVSGDSQTGTVNTTLVNPIVVRVLDQFENPFAGATVNFATTDGSVSSSSGVSDTSGNVTVNWTLGATVSTQTLTVTGFKADGTTPLSGSPLTFVADANAAVGADILQKVSGDSQTGTVNTTLANPIVVRVLDQFENPFAGSTVNFATTDGSVSSSSGVSDANGNVTVNWTLGATVGTQTLKVTGFKADGATPLIGSPLTITANANVVLAADILLEVSGGGQEGYINTTLANPIVVRVLDQFESPFAGATVFFTPTNGSVSAQSVTTDSNGEAQVMWTLGSEITDQLLTVTAFKPDDTTPLSGSPLTFFVSATAPLAIGDFHEGGVVFYLDNTGEHGLVSAITDQASNAAWGCTGTAIVGADGTAIGTGVQNTQDIIAGCTESLIAAEWCSSLNLNGFSDWFLPSKDELNQLFINKAVVDATAITFGGTALQTNFYWSSTELNANQAWGYNVSGDDFKNNVYSVRAV